ncbi:MAG: 1,4-alpha-glucan branching protein GlgB [Candidatus Sumerlaeia bacterium]|nr:1,4-alpha-glucan branching protein GlgB [Candidatus Sumerlaeia bacterium]
MAPKRKESPAAKASLGKATILSDFDLHLFGEGTHYRTWEKFGCHLVHRDGADGATFAVWAPNAEYVSVIGSFNGWDRGAHPMSVHPGAGVWEIFIPGVKQGDTYKFHIASRFHMYQADKADPFGFAAEVRPATASKVYELEGYSWNDQDWMASRGSRQNLKAPISVYELHLGSWRRDQDGNWLSYREIGRQLSEYCVRMGYTHVELLPITEYPYDGSWGYQTVGYFCPTSRFGEPHDLMAMIDALHQAGIGVLLDWVPAHFPKDGHGLGFFDGTHLYEHADPRQGQHQDWGTFVFNYGRTEVRNFLLCSALFWLEKYHIDGLRVDAVASMLYLDYSRKEGEWVPNKYGGRENLDAIGFLRQLNAEVYGQFPDTMMIAEESTAWPMVSKPLYVGGLGFGFKWNMGWMHDVLVYISKDPIHRPYHHNKMTFSMLYAFTENFMLPFSHDEVVHGKGSMLGRMPGDEWQRFANLRLLYGYMWGHPGKKLLFMGQDFGQVPEWNYQWQLEEWVLQFPNHAGVQRWVADLNHLYKREPALYEIDSDPHGFEWVDCDDAMASVFTFLRKNEAQDEVLLFVCNFTPIVRHNYRVGVPWGGHWQEVLNSDAPQYWGSGVGNFGGVEATPVPWHGRSNSVNLVLPPLSCAVFKSKRPL